MMKKIKSVLFNQDGSLNGKMLASLISLGLVLIQQCSGCAIEFNLEVSQVKIAAKIGKAYKSKRK